MYLRDIDSETARLLYALPLNIDTQRNIAEEVADHAPDLLEKLTRHTSAAVRLWSRALVNAKDHSA
jgi:hypothetical protein